MDPPSHSNPTAAIAPSSLPLAGRVAIVTGSARGIGRAVAVHLASLGARLVINYVTSTHLADLLVTQLNSTPSAAGYPCAIAVQADVSDPDAVRRLFDQAEQAFGSPPHILVANAGVIDSKFPAIADTAVEDFDRTFAVNTRGSFLCCREAARRLARGGLGRIVTLSASAALAPFPGVAAYVASVSAVEAMTRVLSKELKGTGITANCVAPGPVETEGLLNVRSGETLEWLRNLGGRLGRPEDIAAVVGFLVSNEAEWVNGQVIRVNGGGM